MTASAKWGDQSVKGVDGIVLSYYLCMEISTYKLYHNFNVIITVSEY